MTTPTPEWNGGEYASHVPRQPQARQSHAPGPAAGHDPYGRRPQPGATAELPPLAETAPPSEPAAAPGPAPAAARRTGSPIIPPGIQPALLTALLAVLTAAAAALGRPALAVAAVLLQAVTAAGWFRLNGMWPARQGILLAFLAGVTTDVALSLVSTGHAPAVVLGTLGVWIVLILLQQMRHRGSADERLSSLTATAAATVLSVLAAGYLVEGGHAVVVGAVAVGAATLIRALPLPQPVSIAAALLVAAAAGIGAAHLVGASSSMALVALAAGICALIGLRVASYDFPSRFVHFTAGVALPLALAAPAVCAVARALGV